jgi:hypothetical protein
MCTDLFKKKKHIKSVGMKMQILNHPTAIQIWMNIYLRKTLFDSVEQYSVFDQERREEGTRNRFKMILFC